MAPFALSSLDGVKSQPIPQIAVTEEMAVGADRSTGSGESKPADLSSAPSARALVDEGIR